MPLQATRVQKETLDHGSQKSDFVQGIVAEKNQKPRVPISRKRTKPNRVVACDRDEGIKQCRFWVQYDDDDDSGGGEEVPSI